MVEPVALLSGEGVSLADIDVVLVGQLHCHRAGGGSLERTNYDTFDARLWRAGLVLEHEKIDGRRWLRVRRLGETSALAQAAVERVPTLVADLADRRLRELLTAAAGERALLPLVKTEGEVLRYAPLDEFDKSTVRVSVLIGAAMAVEGPSERKHLLEPVITIAPLRGHERSHRAMVRAISDRLGQRHAADPLERAAAAVGLELGLNPSDRSVSLDAAGSATEAMAMLLGRHAAVLEANVPGVRSGVDDEYLHDFRVTLRSVRALVSVAHGVLDEERCSDLADRLQQVATRSSPVRDLDVLRRRWNGEDALHLLVPVLEQDRRIKNQLLLEFLDGPALPALLAELRRPVAVLPAEDDGVVVRNAAMWAAEVLSAELARLHRRTRPVLASLAHGGDPAPGGYDEVAVHDARKAVKRLRYLLEAFASITYGARLEGLARAVDVLQSDLGEFQDAVVAIMAIDRSGARVAELSPGALMELGRRSEQHCQLREAAVGHFIEHYRAFARRGEHYAQRLEALATTARPVSVPIAIVRSKP